MHCRQEVIVCWTIVIQSTTQGLKPKDEKLTEEELENDIPENCARSL